MTILSNSKIVLGNVSGFTMNKRDKSYMLNQFWENGLVQKQPECENSKPNMETHVFYAK